jgi:SET domain-containing protein
METKLPDCLEIKESSINGLGVFAKEDIPKGTCLGTYTGIQYTRADFIKKYGKDFRYCYSTQFPWNPIICAKENRHFMTYLNESSEPNVFLKSYKLYANRDIVCEEELTLKYPKQYNRSY